MEGNFSQLPPDIQAQLKGLSKSVSLADTAESYESIAKIFVEKRVAFDSQIKQGGLVEINSFDTADQRAAIALTYSGSLVFIGAMENNSRVACYHRIGLQKTLVDPIRNVDSSLGEPIQINSPVRFKTGPVDSGSSIFKLATFDQIGDGDEQEDKIIKIITTLSISFVELNKTYLPIEDV